MPARKPFGGSGTTKDPVPMEVDEDKGDVDDAQARENMATMSKQRKLDGEGNGRGVMQGAHEKVNPRSSGLPAADLRVGNGSNDMEINSDNETNQNQATGKDSPSAIKHPKDSKLSLREVRIANLVIARAKKVENQEKRKRPLNDHENHSAENESPEKKEDAQKNADPLAEVPQDDHRVEAKKAAKGTRVCRQNSQGSGNTHSPQPVSDNNDNGRRRPKRPSRPVLPPLLEKNEKTLRVCGFLKGQRMFFKSAVMRYGMPTENDALDKWKKEILGRRKFSDDEFNYYSDVFMKNLAEQPVDGEETFSNGVPKDDINRNRVLERLGKMKLIRNKVQEYILHMGTVSMPCPLELVDDGKPVNPGPLIALPNRRDPRLKIEFRIADGIRTLLHNHWDREDVDSLGLEYEIWNRRHDYWLLAGCETHGYKKFQEICDDPLFAILNIPFCIKGISKEAKLSWLKARLDFLVNALLVEAQFRVTSYLFASGVLLKGVLRREDLSPFVKRFTRLDNIAICAALYVENDAEDNVMTFLRPLENLPTGCDRYGMSEKQIKIRLNPSQEAEDIISPTPNTNGQTFPAKHLLESNPYLFSPFELHAELLELT